MVLALDIHSYHPSSVMVDYGASPNDTVHSARKRQMGVLSPVSVHFGHMFYYRLQNIGATWGAEGISNCSKWSNRHFILQSRKEWKIFISENFREAKLLLLTSQWLIMTMAISSGQNKSLFELGQSFEIACLILRCSQLNGPVHTSAYKIVSNHIENSKHI